ncbi:MerR family transcriptional regulator [Companilactobacillus jidongensis]|uniref:MerR family transcriptional regulator n=1 Tax=Companilactobacillus jidongensis TaxID=2486006 RepID=UPI000F7A15A5|nr:MerR family transcriptional regulator [Companilactobacillus jidongensis]
MEQTYSIKEVAEYFNLSISTIRYYDKRGLLPFVSKNDAGYRIFTSSDMALIKTICCLKDTSMPIRDIKLYIDYCMEGTKSIDKRKDLLLKHKRQVILEQQTLENNLKEINMKIDRYSSGNAENIIDTQIKYMQREKKNLHLADPFHIN